MKISDRFDAIIDNVEKAIHQIEIPTSKTIAEDIAHCQGNTYREFNNIFSFLANMTFLQYVNRRRLMYAYESLIHSKAKVCNLDHAIDISGYQNEDSFSKAFKATLIRISKVQASILDHYRW